MRMPEKERLRTRIFDWAAKLRVTPAQIRIQAMSKKWGSCSSAGRVSFSLDLVRRPKTFQDFVIVHELLHLRLRNHGKLFHSFLRAHLRDNPWVSRAISRVSNSPGQTP